MGYKTAGIQNVFLISTRKVKAAIKALNVKIFRRRKVSQVQKTAAHNPNLSKEARLQHENMANQCAYGAHNFNR
ncbi:MAG: hypothetical protein ACFFCQ_01030 [Promethearchaeota archaeon]